jgi:formylglycine-generating enzyme required for sulfatase activity
MLGNVWEWTADAWHESYEGAPVDGSVWDDGEDDALRVIRGGSWNGKARNCRSACRSGDRPGVRSGSLGFRPARVQS